MSTPLHLKDVSGINQARVISLLRDRGPLSRREIAEGTGLSWGGMTKIVTRLMNAGVLWESEPLPSRRGRHPRLLNLSENDHLALGLDVNREGLGGAVTTIDGKSLGFFSRENTAATKEELLSLLLRFAREILSGFSGRHFLTVGVSFQGGVDARAGVSLFFPGIPDWKDVPVAGILSGALGMPAYLEHDPDCILSCCLSRESRENALLLRLDRSVGMAAALNGRVLRGAGILEIAHIPAVPGGKPCRCGRLGCLEAYTAAALKGGVYAPEGMAQLMDPLLRLLAQWISLFNPQRVFLTGRLMREKARFEETLMARFRAAFPDRPVALCLFREGDSAVRGAASLALDRLLHEGRVLLRDGPPSA